MKLLPTATRVWNPTLPLTIHYSSRSFMPLPTLSLLGTERNAQKLFVSEKLDMFAKGNVILNRHSKECTIGSDKG